jgi:hypothetical protein
MEPSQVATSGDFARFLRNPSSTLGAAYVHTLAACLSALWTVVQRHEDDVVSVALLARVLTEAFSGTPPHSRMLG